MDVLKYLATPDVGDESEIRFPIPETQGRFQKVPGGWNHY